MGNMSDIWLQVLWLFSGLSWGKIKVSYLLEINVAGNKNCLL